MVDSTDKLSLLFFFLIMKSTTSITLWIFLENTENVVKFFPELDGDDANLDRLIPHLISHFEILKNTITSSISFFTDAEHIQPLRKGFLLKDLKTTAREPLFVRYRLSDDEGKSK